MLKTVILCSICLFYACSKSNTESTLTNGLVVYYPFNGNANDSSVNKINGIVHNATLTTDRFGNANKAYYFDGVTSFISVRDTSLLEMNKSLSLCAWIKTPGTSYSAGILNKVDQNSVTGYLLRINNYTDSLGEIALYGRDESEHSILDGKNKIFDDKWHFLVGTYQEHGLFV